MNPFPGRLPGTLTAVGRLTVWLTLIDPGEVAALKVPTRAYHKAHLQWSGQVRHTSIHSPSWEEAEGKSRGPEAGRGPASLEGGPLSSGSSPYLPPPTLAVILAL